MIAPSTATTAQELEYPICIMIGILEPHKVTNADAVGSRASGSVMS